MHYQSSSQRSAMEKIHLKNVLFQLPFHHKPTIIMITKMPGIEHFCYNPMFILGFSIFMIPVQIFFPFGSSIGGHSLAVPPECFHRRKMKVGTSGQKQPPQWSPT